MKSTSYTFFIISFAFSLSVPITTLSGFKQSPTAFPSLKNSGFDTISNSKFTFLLSSSF